MSTDAQDIITNAQQTATPQPLTPGKIVRFVTPSDADSQVVDLEQYLDAPRRKRGSVAAYTSQSLIDYVAAHQIDGTALWADVEVVQIVGVINGHTAAMSNNTPGWGDHRATFTARLTPEWKAWLALDGKLHSQADFATFIEDHAADVQNPPAADLLELAKTFKATARAEFRSAIRLDNGTRQLQYVETVDAKAGQTGQFTIPDVIELGLIPFEGAEPYKVRARFRYRLTNGTLQLGVVLDRPDRVLRDAFDAVLTVVADALPDVPLYHGRDH